MVGFGTTLLSAPVVAQVVPLPTLIPAQALLDLVASTGNGMKLSAHVSKEEVLRLLPAMIAGLVVGAYLLVVIPLQALMVLLGAFVVLYALRGMRAPPQRPPIRVGWAWWYGFTGGTLSALFGAGAWLYAIYLVRRLDDPQAIRASQSTMIAISAVTRVGLFAVAGKYSDWNVIVLALTMLPAMALGVFIGNRFAHRLNRAKFLRVLHLVLLGTGGALLIRGLTA